MPIFGYKQKKTERTNDGPTQYSDILRLMTAAPKKMEHSIFITFLIILTNAENIHQYDVTNWLF